eukprot:1000539-Prymnesium_polylepis.1
MSSCSRPSADQRTNAGRRAGGCQGAPWQTCVCFMRVPPPRRPRKRGVRAPRRARAAEAHAVGA